MKFTKLICLDNVRNENTDPKIFEKFCVKKFDKFVK